jgi:CRISPR-associated protein Csb2
LSFSHGYARRSEEPDVSAVSTVFDPRLQVFPLQREDGPVRHLDLVATLQLTARLREAVLTQLGYSAPEVLTGHTAGGRSERPHIAFIPVPFVGSKHAHGGILGIGVAVPREIDADAHRFLLTALLGIRDGIRPDGTRVPENERGLKLGRLGRWSFGVIDSASPVNLRERLWTAAPRGARQWATVTPYVYDRHPKAKDKAAYQRELADSVRESWQRVRQPDQTDVKLEVVITPLSAHLGVLPAHGFPRMTRKDGGECRHSHVILIFERPVVGPLLLGAGRYRGYGFCRPLSEEV